MPLYAHLAIPHRKMVVMNKPPQGNSEPIPDDFCIHDLRHEFIEESVPVGKHCYGGRRIQRVTG